MAETEQTAGETFSYRIRREAHGVAAWYRENWREKRWFRWVSLALLGLLVVWFLVWLLLARASRSDPPALQVVPPPL